MLAVQFFFDFACPWSYLACARLRETAMRTGAEISWRPVDLAALAGGSPGFAAQPERAAWQRADLQAWARYCDLPLSLPADWPRPATAALRGAVYAAAQGRASAYVPQVFRAWYGAGSDIDDVAVLAELARESGLEAAAFHAALSDTATLDTLRANAAELESRGGFRSATMFVGDEMYCGNSRIPLVEFALAQASNRQFVMPGQHG
jgi:2-hydroxychromene-2-carboxylate isomerase